MMALHDQIMKINFENNKITQGSRKHFEKALSDDKLSEWVFCKGYALVPKKGAVKDVPLRGSAFLYLRGHEDNLRYHKAVCTHLELLGNYPALAQKLFLTIVFLQSHCGSGMTDHTFGRIQRLGTFMMTPVTETKVFYQKERPLAPENGLTATEELLMQSQLDESHVLVQQVKQDTVKRKVQQGLKHFKIAYKDYSKDILKKAMLECTKIETVTTECREMLLSDEMPTNMFTRKMMVSSMLAELKVEMPLDLEMMSDTFYCVLLMYYSLKDYKEDVPERVKKMINSINALSAKCTSFQDYICKAIMHNHTIVTRKETHDGVMFVCELSMSDFGVAGTGKSLSRNSAYDTACGELRVTMKCLLTDHGANFPFNDSSVYF